MRQGIIAAVSTPPGKGGVAIIRICGDGAIRLAEGIFRAKSGKALGDYPARTQVYGYIMENDAVLDDGMATYFSKGKSYTGEETVELAIHGGMLITRCVLELLFSHGALPALAGEFTKMAYVNGRISLSEAEAIGMLLDAKSREQITLASSPARERLTERVNHIRERLTRLVGSIYARIDYPDEDLGDFTDEQTQDELRLVRDDLASLIATYKTGRAIAEGITTVLCGKPNAGKSTLYNMLLGREAAIVTDIEGTTRDLLECTVPLGRVMLRLTDTAGVRSSGYDEVEKIGIERARDAIMNAELVLALFDLSREWDSADEEMLELLREARGTRLCLLTKSDMPRLLTLPVGVESLFDKTIVLSSTDADTAIRSLTDEVEHLFCDEKIQASSDAIVASARQHSALTRALGFIDTALDAYSLGISTDAASSDIDLAIAAIGECDGRAVSLDVTDDIFSRFCVGK